ncbi:hypothetical protein EMCRGX_G013971 [Ephydatia muelleri]
MMMDQMLLVLFALRSYVVTATIPPGYAIQEHLRSGQLELNANLVLSDGEHRISSGPPCNISTRGNITIVGSAMKITTVLCEGEGRVFEFISAHALSMERITFINCGIHLISIENILITDCTFQNTTILAESENSWSSIIIEYCLFINNNGYDGVMWLNLSTGNVSISNCTFQNNYGGGVWLSSTGDVSISNCTFQNNSASYGCVRLSSTGDVSISNCTFQNNYGGGVWLSSTGDVSISNCTFQNNSASYGGGVRLSSTGDVSISNCTFQNNYGGGVWLSSTGDVSISNCTFQNNSASFGGGVRLSSTGGVSISNCTFQNNYGGGVWVVSSPGGLSISHCTFQNNSATSYGGGVSLQLSNGDVSISHCTFQNNTATFGGGVSLRLSTGGLSISNCTFQNNTATSFGGGVLLFLSIGAVSISHCTFQNTFGGGVSLRHSSGGLSISNCTFQNNTFGGVSLISSIGDVSISHCTFQNTVGGGVSVYLQTGDVSITKCKFQDNTGTTDGIASNGGAVFLYGISGDFRITNGIFQNNSALNGGAVFWVGALEDILHVEIVIPFKLSSLARNIGITNCTFENNRATNNGGAVFSWNGLLRNILNSTADMGRNGSAASVNITNCSFLKNSASIGGAIFVVSVSSTLINSSTFTNNMAVGGAAVYAVNSYSPSFFVDSNFLTLDTEPFGHLILQGVMVKDNLCSCNDYNELRGGAIYFTGMKVDIFGNTFTGSQFSSNSPLGAIQGTNGFLQLHGNITFMNNTGVNGGAISLTNNVPLYVYEGCAVEFSKNAATGFGGALYNAGDKERIIQSNKCTIRLIKNCKRLHDCNFDINMFFITFIDNHAQQGGHSVYATPIYNCNNCIGVLATGHLVTQSGKCPNLTSYITTSPSHKDINDIHLLSFPNNFQTVVEVTLLPCEPGFTLISNSSTGVMECNCSEFLTSFGVVCDASDGTVTRNKINWIGVYNSTLPALASSCPMDYCNSAIDKLLLARPDELCNGGRTGIICGSCHGNHSVIFGSSQCTICSNMWLITLVMFAGLGALLVAALFFLNLTVTQGTLYGLIFYANMIQINSSIFFHQAIPSLQMIVSFMNLDLGVPMCFYDGMDDVDKAGLQFVFPAYLLILTLIVIVTCHYCLQRSPTTSTSSCLYRFPIIIGERAVGILCTLMYLSYSKLLRTVIDIFTYSTVHLPSGDMYVWFYDGNVEYLQGKHATLFVMAVVTCTLFLLPYTFALTFIPIIEQYSEHNRLFNYLHKLANKFKPVNDAHYAPYKGEWRWWLGARLWLVVVMYSLNPVYSSDNPSLLLSIQATLVMLFMLVQANIQPFGQPLQKMDKCNRHTSAYNKLYNCLDLMYLLNYTALAMSMSYILGKSSNETQISVSVLVGLYVAMLLVTVLYHFIVAILKACSTYDRAKEKINGLFERKYEVMVPTELEESTINTVSTTTVIVTNYLREPLCED